MKLPSCECCKKRSCSLRFRVSSLRRDHANLLCILKRLFKDPATRTEPNEVDILKYIKRCVCFFLAFLFFVPTAGVRTKYLRSYSPDDSAGWPLERKHVALPAAHKVHLITQLLVLQATSRQCAPPLPSGSSQPRQSMPC